ncbi:hypothetical protein [Helicobacter sp. CLO-3]|uniref:hypothetical protein n=1 Tax=Helicobacter sp. CLO-3 TaxID=211 RepID=UPI0012E74BD2|nr:hypothetical protein [Helicobacter sp. CLO-3]
MTYNLKIYGFRSSLKKLRIAKETHLVVIARRRSRRSNPFDFLDSASLKDIWQIASSAAPPRKALASLAMTK